MQLKRWRFIPCIWSVPYSRPLSVQSCSHRMRDCSGISPFRKFSMIQLRAGRFTFMLQTRSNQFKPVRSQAHVWTGYMFLFFTKYMYTSKLPPTLHTNSNCHQTAWKFLWSHPLSRPQHLIKYSSTFYVGIGQVKNGRLYLRYGNSSEKATANWAKTLADKSLCYTIVKTAPRFLLPHSEAVKRKLENFKFVILFFSSSSHVTQKP